MKHPKPLEWPSFYRKILCFEDYGDAFEDLELSEAMCRRLQKLGLSDSLRPQLKSHIESLVLPKSQRLQPKRLFEAAGDLHVEICSGSGEWLAQQVAWSRSRRRFSGLRSRYSMDFPDFFIHFSILFDLFRSFLGSLRLRGTPRSAGWPWNSVGTAPRGASNASPSGACRTAAWWWEMRFRRWDI